MARAWGSESIVEGIEATVVNLLHLPYPVRMEKLSQEPLRRFLACPWPATKAAGKQAGEGDWSPTPRGLSHAEGIVSAKCIGQLERSPCGGGNRGTTV